jgi:hypothetical protein
MLNAVGLLGCLTLAAGLAGCRVHEEKNANGEDKKVQVDTPFGGIHVNSDQTTAADLWLPVYPGAQVTPDSGNGKSADVQMGFGVWKLRVKIVNYTAADSQDKVVAFYKKGLARYGDVIACQDGASVGTPAKTAEGLGCDDEKQPNVYVSGNSASYGYHSDEKGYQLKAGSKRRQHIVAFNSSAPGQTRFSLMDFDLPAGTSGGGGKSD